MKIYKHKDGRCNASGPQIKALREAAGLSQEQLAAKVQLAGLSQSQLAKLAGVGVRVYQNYEQGVRDVSKAQLSTLLRICKALNCKLSDIVTDEETAELLREYEK